ncbi:MAG: 5'-methylthioadenosine/adenosylhomocysteine nucleosidase [Burkholderiales bacterium]|nr:5'-methylthioadenosine/adenosylhomocysteine nucleosidase [Burkholderiales bacterium]
MNLASTNRIKLGIVSALPQEQDGIVAQMQDKHVEQHGMRSYTCGTLWGIDCVCVLARIGKVGAAATTTMLIAQFGVSHILFTGVAGGASEHVKVGDIVVAGDLVQHDMDCSPLFPRYEIPLTGKTLFGADAALSETLALACSDFLQHDFPNTIAAEEKLEFALHAPKVHRGLIASGDEFIKERAKMAQIKESWPQLLAVEMEGAAVAQVCHEFDLPFAVMRTISDGSNEESAVDFVRFIDKVAARYAYAVLQRVCMRLAQA